MNNQLFNPTIPPRTHFYQVFARYYKHRSIMNLSLLQQPGIMNPSQLRTTRYYEPTPITTTRYYEPTPITNNPVLWTHPNYEQHVLGNVH